MKNCKNCQTSFEVTDGDRKFYDQVSPIFDGVKCSIPEPTLCPDCRQQRRLAWRNERTLYKRDCDRCQKLIVSIYQPESPFTVYCGKCWWSDDWDAKDYGKDFDFSRSFFEQWNELNLKVPKLNLINDNHSRSVNCEYTNDFAYGKNCYMVFCSWHQEGCLFSNFANRSNFSSDLSACLDCEKCYECVDCEKCYGSTYLLNSSQCDDCHFSYDLKNCSDCLLSYGLRGKKYHILNQPYSKQEYKEKIKEFKKGNYSALKKMKEQFLKMLSKAPRKSLNLKNCENCTGDYLVDCKNVSAGYDFHNAEDSKFIYMGDGTRSSYDICNTGDSELCYESITCDDSYGSRFTIFSWKNKFTAYTNDCHSCEDIFGCVGLRKEKYCILNKQYSKQDYEKLVRKIIEYMSQTVSLPKGTKTCEWGEFFPASISSFGYNETVAQEYFPLNKEDALEKGFRWSDYQVPQSETSKVIPAAKLPENIDDVPDDILNWAIECETSGKLFKIISQELKFYRDMKLPIPHFHPDERHKQRMNLRNPRKLWDQECTKCQKEIQTTYTPDRPETVYCEECYLKETYE